MVTPRQTQPGTVSDLVNRLLDRNYNQVVDPVLSAISRGTNSGLIQQRLDEFQAETQRLAAEGQKLTADNPVLRALTADLEDELRGITRLTDSASEAIQSTAIQAAGTIQRQLALPGMTDSQLARLGVAWNRPDPEAVARLVSYAQSEAWANTLSEFGDDMLQIVNDQAIRGIVNGWGPVRIATTIRHTVQNLPRHQANNLLRTLQLTSYRDATAAHQQANLHIAQQIIRIAALDTRTCLTCVALHGSVIWDSERDATAPVPRVDDHHSGRCTSVMIVKGRPREIQSGVDWFESLPPERQQQQASFAKSPGKWEAFTTGKLKLADFVQPYQDPVFGPMLRESSLSGALNRQRRTGPIVDPASGQVATPDGYRPQDAGSPGETIDSLRQFLENSDGPLAYALTDIDMRMMEFDASANYVINRDNVYAAAKQFVVESRDFQYGRDYIVGLVTERAQINGVDTSQIDGEQLYNQYMANRAQAIQTLAQIGNVRLTEPQQRRLQRALNGEWLDMVYTTESSERGSLANQALRRSLQRRQRGGGASETELITMRENYRRYILGIDD